MREVEEFLASFPFADTTKDLYGRVLVALAAMDLEALDASGLLSFVTRENWGSSQRYTALCACRKFIAWKFGSAHPALSARVRRTSPRRQRALTVESATRLLASFDTSYAKGARDLALAAVALDTGLRASELCRLAVTDVDLDQCVLQVVVKGGQWACAVFSAETRLYVQAWLGFRRPGAGVIELFVNTITGECLTRQGLRSIVRKWGLSIGIQLTPHDFRRSFATLSTIFGAPSRIVQEAGRWSSITMVELYTRDLAVSAIVPYLPVTRIKNAKQ